MNDETSGNPSARQRNGEIGLVIPGGSKTRDQLEDVWDEAGLRWSERRMWTLNQYMDQRASLHYDIHEHRRHWVRYDAIEAPWIVSPFIPFVDLKPRMQRFELSIILYYFGAPDCPVPLASSVDYLLARAVWLHDLQELTLGAVYLPGIDLVEESHARYLPGAMFWTGQLRARGIEVRVGVESGLWCLPHSRFYPLYYGQFSPRPGQRAVDSFPTGEEKKCGWRGMAGGDGCVLPGGHDGVHRFADGCYWDESE